MNIKIAIFKEIENVIKIQFDISHLHPRNYFKTDIFWVFLHCLSKDQVAFVSRFFEL